MDVDFDMQLWWNQQIDKHQPCYQETAESYDQDLHFRHKVRFVLGHILKLPHIKFEISFLRDASCGILNK